MPGQDRNLSRKAPMANDLLLRWEGNQQYQPQIQHPVAKTPKPYADPNYEAQVTPPAQQIGLQVPQMGSQEEDDFDDNERQTYESLLNESSMEEVERFFERLQKFKRMRESGLLSGQRKT